MINITRLALIIVFCIGLPSSALAYWGAMDECDPFGEKKHEYGLFMQNSEMSPDTEAFLDSDISETQFYVQTSYAISECVRSYFRVNVLQFTATDLFGNVEKGGSPEDFESIGYGVAVGMKGPFRFYHDWAIGGFVQGSWYGPIADDAKRSSNNVDLGPVDEDEEMEITSRLEFAGGVQLERLTTFGRLYSGIVLQLSQMSVNSSTEVSWSGLTGRVTATEDTSESFNSALDASIFLGGVFNVYPNLYLTGEIQAGARTSFGVSLSYYAF